jgi:hypothetical protein
MKKPKNDSEQYFINNPKILKTPKFERLQREIYLKYDVQQDFRIYKPKKQKKLRPMLFDQNLVKEKMIKFRPHSNL